MVEDRSRIVPARREYRERLGAPPAAVAARVGQAVAFGLGLLGWFGNPLLIFFALGSAVTVAPLVTSLRPTLPSLALAASIAGVLLAAYAGSLAAVMAEQFPPEVRTAGISLPYGVAVAVFGGLSPLVATALLDAGRFHFFLAGVVVLCLASAVVYWRMPETKDLPL